MKPGEVQFFVWSRPDMYSFVAHRFLTSADLRPLLCTVQKVLDDASVVESKTEVSSPFASLSVETVEPRNPFRWLLWPTPTASGAPFGDDDAYVHD